MGSNKKRQQTISKRNRERAIEEKRTLKRERKQAQAAKRAAIRDGTWVEPVEEWDGEPVEGEEGVEAPAGENDAEAPAAENGAEAPASEPVTAEPPVEAPPPDGE